MTDEVRNLTDAECDAIYESVRDSYTRTSADSLIHALARAAYRAGAAAQVPRVTDLEEFAWTIIANAGEGDWLRESKAWGEAAVRWRTEYHAKLDAAPRGEPPAALDDWRVKFHVALGRIAYMRNRDGEEIDMHREELRAIALTVLREFDATYCAEPPKAQPGSFAEQVRETMGGLNMAAKAIAPQDDALVAEATAAAYKVDAERYRREWHKCRRHLRAANKGAELLSKVCRLHAAEHALRYFRNAAIEAGKK